MAKPLPFGHSYQGDETAKLSYWGGKGETELIDIQIGSPAWFAWLEQERSFRMIYRAKTGAELVQFTVRPEKRKNQRIYWQAWKTIKSRTTKKYIGPTAKVSKAKLDEAGQWFAEQLAASREPDREAQLLDVVRRLAALVEELAYHCPDAGLRAHAGAELARIEEETKED